ncbi:MAG: GGDEF domain-containing protein [Hyphomicrobiaceae bacterium]|nr:GGDEF domain-containing protein [Hyphomicrobiaceae bacterium]
MRTIEQETEQSPDIEEEVSLDDWQSLADDLLAQNEALTQEVHRLAGLCEQDALLQILNRRGLERALSTEIARVERYAISSSFIFIDIDYFKEINDGYGHVEGDRMLQRLTRHIAGQLRSCDHFARLGGDEFGIILPNTTVEQAIEKAEKLSASLGEDAKNWGNSAHHLSFSAGVSKICVRGRLDEIIRLADQQMYLQKEKRHKKQ